MLLEALVAILIFSLGVLSVIQLQAVSIRQASSAEYRSMAALLANDLISRMWVGDKSIGALQANFSSSPAGTNYTQWLSSVSASGLPNVSSAQQTLPTVTITSLPGSTGGAPSYQATVVVYWREPGDTTNKHSYELIAQLK